MLRRRRRRTKPPSQNQGSKGNDAAPGRPDGHQAPEGHPNGQGAGATTARKNATAPALTENWKGSDGGLAAQTGTKTDENAEEAAVAAGTAGANVETKKETAGMTRAGGRTGNTIKIEAWRGRSPGIRRTGERPMTGGIKTTGRGTEKRGRPKGRAGVEAGRRDTKVVERRRAGRESLATAEIKTGRETEHSVLTNVVVAKRGAIIPESPVMTIVNIVNADGVRALSKCRRAAILLLLLLCLFSSFLSAQLSDLPLVLKKMECQYVGHLELLSLANVMLLYVLFFCLFHSLLDHC